jgi:hypothetical protein
VLPNIKKKRRGRREIHEEMFSILNHKRNANQNGAEIPFHSSQNGHQENKQQMLVRMQGLLVGMSISATTMEIRMQVPPKTKNRTIM